MSFDFFDTEEVFFSKTKITNLRTVPKYIGGGD